MLLSLESKKPELGQYPRLKISQGKYFDKTAPDLVTIISAKDPSLALFSIELALYVTEFDLDRVFEYLYS